MKAINILTANPLAVVRGLELLQKRVERILARYPRRPQPQAVKIRKPVKMSA